MKVYHRLAVYTGDVSGVCSALYELGGMVVIHDPSGCNSTYNTHDEVRWYDHPSQIFISGLKESDAVMGNDQRLIDETAEAALELHPAFIALVNSPVPYLIGTDMKAIAEKIEKKTGIPCFYISTNAFHDYAHGIALAMKALVMKMSLKAAEKIPYGINILGVTPLDYTHEGTVAAMKNNLSDFHVISCMLKDTDLESVRQCRKAQANLVVSSSGLLLAKWMEKHYQIPYVIGVPLLENKEEIRRLLLKAIETQESQSIIDETAAAPDLVLIGEPVLNSCIGQILSHKYHRPYQVICPLEDHVGLMRKDDLFTQDEVTITEVLSKASIVIGDPIYQRVCDCRLIRMPHLALSGRLYLKEMKNVCDMRFE